MSIIGIGTDLVEISRIKTAENESFLKKYFSTAENKLFDSLKNQRRAQTIAANFAAKEALVKALGTGFADVSPDEIETLRDVRGRPYINVVGNAKKECDKLGVNKIHVTMTHVKEYAQAFVVLEK